MREVAKQNIQRKNGDVFKGKMADQTKTTKLFGREDSDSVIDLTTSMISYDKPVRLS